MTFTSNSLLAERYQLQQRLGNTAIGRQTWLATDVLSQESVIIKLLAFSPQMEWEELKLFERESAVLASLSIIPVFPAIAIIFPSIKIKVTGFLGLCLYKIIYPENP
jgi:serine/threonine protein kinase